MRTSHRRLHRHLLCAVGLWCVADASAEPTLKINKVSAVTHQALPVLPGPLWDPARYELRTPPAGHTIVEVTANVTPQWDEKSHMLRLKRDEVALLDGDKVLPSAGYFSSVGYWKDDHKGLEIFRGQNQSAGPGRPVRFSRLFVAPAKTDDFVFKLGTLKTRVKVAGPAPRIDMKEYVRIEIKSARLLDAYEKEEKRKDPKRVVRQAITNPGGKILELDLSILAIKSNSNSGRGFYWLTGWFTIQWGDGSRAGCLGEPFGPGTLTLAGNHSPNVYDPAAEHPVRPSSTKLYFAVPSDLEDFRVYMLGRNVATGRATK